MDKIRILHCPIGNMDVGGIENMLMQTYRVVDKERYQFDFVVHKVKKNYYEEEIEALGGKVFRVPFISKKPFKHVVDFIRLLKEHPEYDIIHFHTTYAITLFDVMVAKMLKRYVIVHSHNSSANKKRSALHKLLKRSLSQMTDCKVACSKIASKWLFKEERDVIIWKNAIDLSKFKYNKESRKKIRCELGVQDDTVILGNVGRLAYQKNQKYLIKIFENYHINNKNSILVLVGDGEDRKELEQYIQERNLFEMVKLVGSRSNVEEYLDAFDVFVLSSRYEGFGIVMIEAQAAGLPIVAGNVVDDTVKISDNFFIVKNYSNIQEWSETISKLQPLEEKMRAEAYDVVVSAGFDISTYQSFIMQFYDEIVQKVKQLKNRKGS